MNAKPLPLTVYGQDAWHDPVYIVGSREALTGLMEAIRVKLADAENSATRPFYVHGDGEEYLLQVQVSDGEDDLHRAVPYFYEYAKETNDKAIWPFNKEGQNDDREK